MDPLWLSDFRDDLPIARSRLHVWRAATATRTWVLMTVIQGLGIAFVGGISWVFVAPTSETAAVVFRGALVLLLLVWVWRRWRAWRIQAPDRAIAFYARGDYGEAGERLAALVEAIPVRHQIVVLPYLISTRWHLGDPQGALVELDRLEAACALDHGEDVADFVERTLWKAKATRIVVLVALDRIDEAREVAGSLRPPEDLIDQILTDAEVRLRIALARNAVPDAGPMTAASEVLAEAVNVPEADLSSLSALLALLAWGYRRRGDEQAARHFSDLLRTRGDEALARRRAAAAMT